MGTYRALCIFQGKGRPSVQVVEAASADEAAAGLRAAGWVVGKVEEVAGPAPKATPTADPAAAGVPPVPPTRYVAAPKGRSWFVEFFTFRLMVLPSLVRAGFALMTVFAVIATAIVVVGAFVEAARGRVSGVGMVRVLLGLVWIWGGWLAWRLFAEFMIVVFSINERAGELVQHSARAAGKVRPANCARCGYDLRGLEGETCPECGQRW